MRSLYHRLSANPYSREIRLFVILAVIFIAMSLVNPRLFLSHGNLTTMAKQMPELGLMTLAMMLVVLTGSVNLSNVSTGILSGILCALVMSSLFKSGADSALCIGSGLAVGLFFALLCGFLNGFFVAVIGVAPMLATLASSTLFRGISLNITQGAAVSGFPRGFYLLSRQAFLGIPVLLWTFLIAAGVTHLLLTYTPWGRKVYMIGCNSLAAEYAGVTVRKELFKVYFLSAALSFLAGLVMISRYNSAKVDYGSSYLLQSLAACVLGAMDINGGRGSVLGVTIAVAVLQVISSGMNIMSVNRFSPTS